MGCRERILLHMKFLHTSNAVTLLKINSNINLYNVNNDKMRKSIFESFTCFII